MAQSDGKPVAPPKGRKKHLQDGDLFACTFTDGKTYKVPWRDVKLLFVDPPCVWHIKDVTGGPLNVSYPDAVFDMSGNELSGPAAEFAIQNGQEVLIFGNEVSFEANGGKDDTCNWNFGDLTDTRTKTMWTDMFRWRRSFNGDIQHLDVTEAAFDIQYMFEGCFAFNQPVNHFNTKNVNTIRACFQSIDGGNSNSFNFDVNWDLSNCQIFSLVFNQAKAFDSNLPNWDLRKATTMLSMFWYAQQWTGKGMNTWKGTTSAMKDMRNVFTGCGSWTGSGVDFASWDVSSVTDFKQIFASAVLFQNKGLESWRTPNCIGMEKMFHFSTSVNLDLRGWCVPKIGSRPPNFAVMTAGMQEPVWGTCP